MINEPIRIFLVDDDDDDCCLFRDALGEVSQSYQLTVAKDGVEIMETLREKIPPSPHYLFLDINMPLKNGLQCLAEIRSIPHYTSIPVIMLSTSIDEKYVQTAQNLGAVHYIRKPDSFSGLKRLLQKVLDMKLGTNENAETSNFLITSF
jgi:CheY-like chemotaxis protein